MLFLGALPLLPAQGPVTKTPAEKAPAKKMLSLRESTPYVGVDFSGRGFVLPTWEDSKTLKYESPYGSRYEDVLSGKPKMGPAKKEEAEAEIPDAQEVYASPDGKQVAYVKEHNLYVLDRATKKTWPVSNNGNELLRYGRLDWVYQEEVYTRGEWRAHWWSPDSKKLAFMRLDESKVKTFTVIDHVPATSLDKDKTVKELREHYPKAGDPNPKVAIGVALPAQNKVLWVDLSKYDPDILVVRTGWTPDNQLLLQVDLTSGAVTRLLREESKTWVNILDVPWFLYDGSFIWLSERSGFNHIYHYKGDKLLAAVTQGDWAVREILHMDAKEEFLLFTAGKDGALNNNLYRIGLDGKGLQRLTQGDGSHEVSLSIDGKQFVDRYSSVTQPPRMQLCDDEGKVLREMGEVRVPNPPGFALQTKELLQIPARDGFLLDATVLLPGKDAAKRKAGHPVFLDTYSGPNFPSVRNSWNYDSFHQFLAQQGVIVLQLNVRSASGRSQADTGTCYLNLGAVELRDLEDAVDWVCAKRGGDAQRVGISGWSYGGFMTAYALTHSKKFALGLAGAGVYDWRMYDSIYTERYMRTPQENKDGYRKSSVVEAAKNLHGHLLLMHGTMDDNVHLQNAMQLVHALQNSGKSFELMLYPKMKHGPNSLKQLSHRHNLQWRAIEEHLLAP